MLKALTAALQATALSTTAQNTLEPQKPSPEVKQLDCFVGDWKLEGETSKTPFSSGGHFKGTEQNEWMSGGYFLISHSEQETILGKSASMTIFGWDPATKVYTMQSYNSSGQAESAKGSLERGVWTWTHESIVQGKIFRGRFMMKVLSPLCTSSSMKCNLRVASGSN